MFGSGFKVHGWSLISPKSTTNHLHGDAAPNKKWTVSKWSLLGPDRAIHAVRIRLEGMPHTMCGLLCALRGSKRSTEHSVRDGL